MRLGQNGHERDLTSSSDKQRTRSIKKEIKKQEAIITNSKEKNDRKLDHKSIFKPQKNHKPTILKTNQINLSRPKKHPFHISQLLKLYLLPILMLSLTFRWSP